MVNKASLDQCIANSGTKYIQEHAKADILRNTLGNTQCEALGKPLEFRGKHEKHVAIDFAALTHFKRF